MDGNLAFRIALGLLLFGFFFHRGYYTKRHADLDDRTVARRSSGDGVAWFATTAIDITARIRYEERWLAGQFGGQYFSYAKGTGRLIPRLPFAPE